MKRLRFSSFIGPAVFFIGSLAAFIRIGFEPVAEHYRLFVTASDMMWSGENPYGVPISTVGLWFYSPCTMYFFKIFSILPMKVGQMVYMGFSWVLFVTGFRALMKELGLTRVSGWFWFLITAQILGAIWATKLELFMLGALSVSLLLLIRKNSFPGWAAFILATLCSWKFLLLPTVGLLGLVTAFYLRQVRFSILFLMFVCLWFLSPLLRVDWDTMILFYQTQAQTLEGFASGAFFGFDNIFSFLHNSFSLEISWDVSRFISMVGAVIAAGVMGLMILDAKNRKKIQSRELIRMLILAASAVGSAYTVLFNPLTQNNALIQLAPYYVWILYLLEYSQPRLRRVLIGTTLFLWLVLTFAYTHIITDYVRPFAPKSGAVLISVVIVLGALLGPMLREFRAKSRIPA